MSYDPYGSGLFPDGYLDDPEGPRGRGWWRRNGSGDFTSPGDRMASKRAEAECRRIGRQRRMELERMKRRTP